MTARYILAIIGILVGITFISFCFTMLPIETTAWMLAKLYFNMVASITLYALIIYALYQKYRVIAR